MKSIQRLDARIATVLAISLAFAVAACIMFVQMLGLVSGKLDLAKYMFWIPVLGIAAVGALTWWVIFPRWREGQRVRTLVRETTGVGQAELDQEQRREKNSWRLRLGWIGGLAVAGAIVLLLRSRSTNAPLWIPIAAITILTQLSFRQNIEERVRSLAVCGVLLATFGGVGRDWLTSAQGSILLGTGLFGLVGWHFWQQKRGLSDMQRFVQEARYDQAVAKAELSPSTFAPALKAYALFRQGDTAGAKAGLRLALAKSEDAHKASFALAKYGELLLAEGNLQEALAPVEAALKLRPEETRAHRVMAQIFLEQIHTVQRGRARRQSDVAQQLAVLAHAQAGHQAAPSGSVLVESALKHATKAVEFAPNRGGELAVLAWAQAAAGQDAEAQQTVQKASQAITDQLDVAEGRYFLGRAYRLMGQTDWSRSCFEAVKGAESRGYYRSRAEQALAELDEANPKPAAETAVSDLQSLGSVGEASSEASRADAPKRR